MKEQLINHYVTMIIKSNKEELDGLMISEEDKDIKHHDEAIMNIDNVLNRKYKIPYLDYEVDNLAGLICGHTQAGDILLLNRSNYYNAKFYIYMPEVIDKIQTGILVNCLNLLEDTEIQLEKVIDGISYTVDVNEYLHNNQKNLTIPLHFENN